MLADEIGEGSTSYGRIRLVAARRFLYYYATFCQLATVALELPRSLTAWFRVCRQSSPPFLCLSHRIRRQQK